MVVDPPDVVLLAVTVAEDQVFAAGTEPWAVLWRILAKRQSDWKQHYRCTFSGEGLRVFPLSFTSQLKFTAGKLNIT